MADFSNKLIVPALILATALPALASLAYFRFSGDVTFRPLGITTAKLAETRVSGVSRSITVQIEWGTDANSPNSQEQVKQALTKALNVYPGDFLVRFQEVEGNSVQVYFLVDRSRVGPYRLQNLSTGIPAAVAAQTMASRDLPAR